VVIETRANNGAPRAVRAWGRARTHSTVAHTSLLLFVFIMVLL